MTLWTAAANRLGRAFRRLDRRDDALPDHDGLTDTRVCDEPRDGKPAKDNRSHGFDTGAAWACLALQASLEGWVAHAIGGFDEERARRELALPGDLALHCFVAIGRHAADDDTKANERAAQSSFVRAGPFPG